MAARLRDYTTFASTSPDPNINEPFPSINSTFKTLIFSTTIERGCENKLTSNYSYRPLKTI